MPSPLAKLLGKSKTHWQESLAEPSAVNILHAVTDGTVGPPCAFGRVDALLLSIRTHHFANLPIVDFMFLFHDLAVLRHNSS